LQIATHPKLQDNLGVMSGVYLLWYCKRDCRLGLLELSVRQDIPDSVRSRAIEYLQTNIYPEGKSVSKTLSAGLKSVGKMAKSRS